MGGGAGPPKNWGGELPAGSLSFVNLTEPENRRLRITKRFLVCLTQQNEINQRNLFFATFQSQKKNKVGQGSFSNNNGQVSISEHLPTAECE